MMTGKVWATHLTGLNANNLTQGTLDSARLNPSSVTLQGNNIVISNLATSTQDLKAVDTAMTVSTTSLGTSTGSLQAVTNGLTISTTNLLNTINAQLPSKDYDVILGTDAALGVDFANSTASLTLAQMKVNNSSSATSGIGFSALMRSGLYTICSATIPLGMNLFASYGTSVTVMIPNASSCTWNIYGIVDGINFDYRSLPYTYPVLQVGTGGVLKNSTIYRADGMSGAITGKIFRVENSTNVKIQNVTIDRTAIPSAVTWQGDGNICVINKSTDVDLTLHSKTITAFTSQAGLLLIRASTRVDLHDSFWEQMGGYHVILIGENIDCSIRNNHGMIVGTDNANGSISIDNPGAAGNGVSSGTVVSGNYFEERSGGSTTVFGSIVAANSVFFNNTVSGRGASTRKGFTTGAASNGNIIQMNRVFNRAGSAMTFISDSGSGSIYTSQGNILDKTAQ